MDTKVVPTGIYADKKRALEILTEMGVSWNSRQIDLTAELDVNGNRKWPWFIDEKVSFASMKDLYVPDFRQNR